MVNLNASGTVTILAHVVRDASGQVISGSVDFNVRYQFPGEVTVTAMHIHRGTASANGLVVIDSGLQRFTNTTGAGTGSYQGQVEPGSGVALEALRGLLQAPDAYYVNMHTTANPSGVMRGQLQRAEMSVYMSLLDAANQVPPVSGVPAAGVGSFTVITSRDDFSRITSAEATFEVNYSGFPAGTNFTGLHIHRGWPTENGPVTINSGLSGPVATAESGAGTLRYQVEVPVSEQTALDTLADLASNPADYYMNVHTQAYPLGVIRGAMRKTDRMSFPVTLLPANEVPAVTGVDAAGPALFTAHTVRDNFGAVVGGVAVFDLNYRLKGEVQFTGMHIHDGAAGQNGLVTIDSGLNKDNQAVSPTGFGNLYRQATISAPRGVQSMNSLAANPEQHYYNVHTSVNPNGLMRAQLSQAMTALPSVAAVIAANSDPAQVTMAPLGLVTIFGANLMKVPVGSDGFGNYAPLRLNGTSVKIAGLDAAVVVLGRVPSSVPADFIVAQVPVGAPDGVQPVSVTNSNGAGSTSSILVNTVAPAVYFDGVGGIVYKIADMRLVRPDNPARAGEKLAVVSTGLGQTTPALATGEFSNGSNVTAPVTVTVGGLTANVLSSTALPGMPGVYWTVFEVPPGLSPIPVTLRLTLGGIQANPVQINVQ